MASVVLRLGHDGLSVRKFLKEKWEYFIAKV